ncbi:MAG: hypothetical protein O6952_04120, partial [Planctomycetota bacterium]|nr:hypothetical protein [Planctomycetota bacterium]
MATASWLPIALSLLSFQGIVSEKIVADQKDPARSERAGETSDDTGLTLEQLLLKGMWAKAAAAHGGEYYDLERAVRSAWEQAGDLESQSDRNRLRYQLALFYYSHVAPAGRLDGRSLLGEIASLWEDGIRSVPQSDPTPLDFSERDLLPWATKSQSKAWEDGVTAEDESRILAALRRSPESIPALEAFAACFRHRKASSGTYDRLLESAQTLLTSRFSRLWLARTAETRGYKSGALESRTRILQRGWSLAPTEAERAHLYRKSVQIAALLLEEATGEKSVDARVRAERDVWMRFPGSRAAASARKEAVCLLTREGRLRDALHLVRRLQGLGDRHTTGLDTALWTLARGYERAGDRR